MATIRVFSAEGVKELKCFDILQNVDYLDIEEEQFADDEAEASDDSVDF